jgi:allophanate hydrolase subunit 2
MGDRVRFVPVPGGAAVSRIHVLAPGFLTTVQDLGRFGYAHFGISASGAADPLALRAGNLLVGNAENAPALEMTLTGGEFAFEGAAVISSPGGFRRLRSHVAACGNSPRRNPCALDPRAGARCYLSVRGGLDVPLVMGSASVHVMTGVGGRPLRRGDVLPIGDRAVRRPRKPAHGAPAHHGMACLRTTAGPQARWFGDELYAAGYRVRRNPIAWESASQGPALPSPGGHMITEGVPLGAVQAPPGRTADHPVRGTPDHRRVSQAGQRDLGGFLAARPVAPARRSPLRAHHHGRRAGLLRDQEEWLYSL